MRWPLEHTFVDDLPWLGARVDPVPVADPSLVWLDETLAAHLGLDPADLRSEDEVAVLAGNRVPEDAVPVAQAYAGHQFGHLSPVLGDGRAHLLGEIVDTAGRRVDLALKGSGRTPFARGGDGRAVLGPMLREALVSTFMHAAGVPTTRALAVVATGERVLRERPLPGAVLTRVAASHLRVGTVVFVAQHGTREHLEALTEHVRTRHYPELSPGDPMALLSAVVERQADLVATWMSLGFVHGVMNSDNMTLSGETIDYGPCAFLDGYDPESVFSSIDAGGRYRYSAQPAMAMWDLARLAEALLPLADDPQASLDEAQERLDGFRPRYEEAWLGRFRRKLGLPGEEEGDRDLVEDLLTLAEGDRDRAALDLTGLFRGLACRLRGETAPTLADVVGTGPWDAWETRWRQRVDDRGGPGELGDLGDDAARATAERMDAVNPIFVPRNHLVEEALAAAHAGNLAPFEELVTALRSPFDPAAGPERLTEPADPAFTRGYVTYCGT